MSTHQPQFQRPSMGGRPQMRSQTQSRPSRPATAGLQGGTHPYSLTPEEVKVLEAQGYAPENPYYNTSYDLATSKGNIPIGQAKWYAKYTPGSLMSEEELNQLLQSKNLIEFDDYSDRKNMYAGGNNPYSMHAGMKGIKDYAAFWDPYDPKRKSGVELRWSPEYEYTNALDLIRKGSGRTDLEAILFGQSQNPFDDYSGYGYKDPKTGLYTSVPIDPKWFEGWDDELVDASYGAPVGGPGRFSRRTGKYVINPGHSTDIARYLEKLAEDDNEGFFGSIGLDFVDDLLDVPLLGEIVSFLYPPAAPFIYGAKGVQALDRDDSFGAFMNFAGAAGFSPGKWGAQQLTNAGMNSTLANALSSGTIGGLGAVSRGGDFGKGFLGGATSGGLNPILSSNLPTNLKWAASPLAHVGSSLVTKTPITPRSLGSAVLRSTMDTARQPLVKGTK